MIVVVVVVIVIAITKSGLHHYRERNGSSFVLYFGGDRGGRGWIIIIIITRIITIWWWWWWWRHIVLLDGRMVGWRFAFTSSSILRSEMCGSGSGIIIYIIYRMKGEFCFHFQRTYHQRRPILPTLSQRSVLHSTVVRGMAARISGLLQPVVRPSVELHVACCITDGPVFFLDNNNKPTTSKTTTTTTQLSYFGSNPVS